MRKGLLKSCRAGVNHKFLFKLYELRTHDVLAMIQHAIHARLNLWLQGLVLGFEIDEGDRDQATSVS